jgi:pyrroloquinoline quinone (PQQ) biosynthesis protein C
MNPAPARVLKRLDHAVDKFCRRTRYFREALTPARARMFVKQHRLNSRHRNSVLKLRVATNCPDWDTRIAIIAACAQEVLADHEHGGGKPHWQILEELGTRIGLSPEEIRAAQPLSTTALAWAAWDGLMSDRHWLEGIVANTCAERANVPGYGDGILKARGWFGLERERWGRLFGLDSAELEFFELHSRADVDHSGTGWHAVGRFAAELGMEDAVVAACEQNLRVWELYLNGIGDAADREG